MSHDAGTRARPAILLVAHHYPPHVGGMEIVVQRQAQSLAEHGFDVTVLTSMTDEARERRTRQDGITVIRVPCWHFFERRFFIPFPVFSPTLLQEARKLVRKVDIVHIHDVFYVSSWLTAILAYFARKPMFLTQHVALVEHSNKAVMWAQRLVYATIGAWIFKRAQRIVVYNDNVRTFLASRNVPPQRLLQLRNGIDIRAFRPPAPGERLAIRARWGLPSSRPLVLFVGRLVEKKGVHILLESKDSGFDLVFAGPGPIPESGRKEGIYWLGAVDQQRAGEIYRACDLFAFPAIGEIFTLVMQEALASGVPVVTTDDPAYANNPAADCMTQCRRDPAAFRSAINELLKDKNRIDDLGSRSREVATRYFDWKANFSLLAAEYTGIPITLARR